RGRRVEEEGGSEGRPVAGRIGVEPSGEITPRESGPTSLWCLRTKPSEQLAWETEQMTAACLLVRSPACSARQLQTSIVQVVHLCPTGFRKEPCERLERHKPKGLRVVLRGLGSSNAPRLPGRSVSDRSQRGRVWARPDPAGGAWSVKRGAWGESIVASESEGREPALIEKRQNEARAKKARERRTSTDAQKPFVETLRVGIPLGKAGTSSRKRVLRAVMGDHHHEA